MKKSQLTGLAYRLVASDLLNQEKAIQASNQAKKQKLPLISYLVESEIVNSVQVATLCAKHFGVALFDIDSFDTSYIPKDLLDEKLIRKHQAIPLFKRGKRLFLAVSDPTNIQAIEAFRFNTGLVVDYVLTEHNSLERAIDAILDEQGAGTFEDLEDEEFDAMDIETAEQAADENITSDIDDTPVVRFVKKMLLTAIKKGSSDLHFEPYEKSYRVRFRTDGILHQAATPPLSLSTRIASRLKIMSGMDIAERRVPQDGRIKMNLSKNKTIDFRVNTLPTLWGEKIVLRILDPSSAKIGIDALGYEPEQKEMYLKALHKPQGMILVTGPTGSGKTVSLYTGLNILNTMERNISTAEDPVEINLEGVNQVNVNIKQGMDFSNALRAFLRQDPDIIMVGEIRDLETANIAIKAAQTGHMVLSTLHTNSAPETLTRLLNMGVPAFNLATSVNLIIAQRLARKLCSACKKKQQIPQASLIKMGFTQEQAKTANLYLPVGCDNCNEGYKGRLGIYEVVHITPKIADIIMREGNSIEIAKAAEAEGFNNLRQSALKKVYQGLTSLEEVNRITLD